MNKRKEYITNPAVIISCIVAVFGFGVTWGTLNHRINNLEKHVEKINYTEIQATLSQIQTDISRIKMTLNSK